MTRNGAVLSEDEVYRYRLWRDLGLGTLQRRSEGSVLWVMLNPSTADHMDDDPTIRRVIGFSKDLGFERLMVGNLFALRSTDPKVLKTHGSPVGPDNDQHLVAMAKEADFVICAWGAETSAKARAADVVKLLHGEGCQTYCLGRTKSGQPRHPLFMPKTAKPEVMT